VAGPQFYDSPPWRRSSSGSSTSATAAVAASTLQFLPTLFDLIDESKTGELESSTKRLRQGRRSLLSVRHVLHDQVSVRAPHPWNVDFPHLMLRAKAAKNPTAAHAGRQVLSSTDTSAGLREYPLSARSSTRSMQARSGERCSTPPRRGPAAPIPKYHSRSLRSASSARPRRFKRTGCGTTRGKVALFATATSTATSRASVWISPRSSGTTHRGGAGGARELLRNAEIRARDLQAVADLKARNVPPLIAMIERGYDIVAPIPPAC